MVNPFKKLWDRRRAGRERREEVVELFRRYCEGQLAATIELVKETVPDGERVEEYNRGYMAALTDLAKYQIAEDLGKHVAYVEMIPGGYQRVGLKRG